MSGDKGGRSPALSQQQAGERMDFTASLPSFASDVPANMQTFSPTPISDFSPAGKSGLGVSFSEPPAANAGSMDLGGGMGVGTYGAESGSGAATGAMGSAAASGLGGLAGMGAGMLPGLIGQFAGAGPGVQAGLNAAGAPLGAAVGGATTGALAGTGAAAGAATGAAAAVPALMVLGPKIVADIINGIKAETVDSGNIRKLMNRVKNIQTQYPALAQQLETIPGIAGELTSASTPEKAADVLKRLNTIQKGFQDNGWEAHMKQGGTTVIGETADFDADLDPLSRALIEQTNRVFPQMDLARLRATDMLEKSGYTPERIATETGRYVGPKEWAQNMGTNLQYFDQESGARDVRARSYNPYLTEHFQKPGQARDAATWQLEDMQARMREGQGEFVQPGTYRTNPQGGMWDEAANQAFAQFQPGQTEKGLSELFGGQFADAYKGMNVGGGPGAGALPGSDVGGAGKRSPQFLTPELDNRAEAGTGKLGGGRPGVSDPGTPFGMGGAKRGGMQVGGGPRGNAPFGGTGRQTMMPQQGGGVQARSNRNQGVV